MIRLFGNLFLFLFASALAIPASATVLNESVGGFSLDIPERWEEESPDIVAAMNAQAAKVPPSIKLVPIAHIFKLKDNPDGNSSDKIIIKIEKSGRVPESELWVDARDQMKSAEKKISNAMPDLVGNSKLRTPTYDDALKLFWLRGTINVVNVGNIETVNAIVPTEYGDIQVLGVTRASDVTEFSNEMYKMMSTLKLHKGVQYIRRKPAH